MARGSLLSTTRVGDLNRSRILQALVDRGPTSRADLAKLTGATRATVSNIVQALLDAGLVEELEPVDTGRVGKPATPIWFTPGAGLSGAITLRRGRGDVALVDARGTVLAATTVALPARTGAEEVAGHVAAALAGLADGATTLGVGVAVPGVCDTAAGAVIASGQLPELAGTALATELGRRLGTAIVIDNDSRAQALGEKWFGRGRGFPTFASVQTGDGLGVGLVVDGCVYRGDGGRSGELGHTAVVADGDRCRCGLRGCWETVATLRWLRQEAAARGLPQAKAMDAARLLAAADDSTAALELFGEYADRLALGLANLVNLLGPMRLILHGDAAGGGEAFRGLVEDATRRRCLATVRPGVDVVLSPDDEQAGLLGAAGLVLSATFDLAT